MSYGVIYLITNIINGMKYVGQTRRPLKVRISEHKRGSQCVDKAIQKYGWGNFKIEVPEECDSQEKLDTRENFWICELNCKKPSGYNLTDGGKGTLRFSHQPEVCAKISTKSLMSVFLKMRGKYNFTAKDIAKLVEIFGKSPEYLMARDDE